LITSIVHTDQWAIERVRWNQTQFSGHEIGLETMGGAITFAVTVSSGGPGGKVDGNPYLADWKRDFPEGNSWWHSRFTGGPSFSGGWFRFLYSEDNRQLGLERITRSLTVPLWMPLIVFAVLPVRWLVLRRRHRAPFACPSCGYDLRATPDRCPECGYATAS
jgi:hypothetical protein